MRYHLDEDVESGLLKFGDASVLSQLEKDGRVELVLLGAALDVSEFHKPRVLESLVGCESDVRIDDEQLLEEGLGFFGDLLKLFVLEVKLGRLNLVEDNVTILTLERQVSTQEHVHQHSQRPDVALLSVVALENFGGHVIRCASDSLHVRVLAVELPRQPEVDKLDLAICTVHDVLGLDISVDDPRRMTVIYCSE